jgi:hypothetical protein
VGPFALAFLSVKANLLLACATLLTPDNRPLTTSFASAFLSVIPEGNLLFAPSVAQKPTAVQTRRLANPLTRRLADFRRSA